MARVLILEPDAEVRELIGRVVSRLGHEALAPARPPRRAPAGIEAIILEPDWPAGLELARALRAREGKTRSSSKASSPEARPEQNYDLLFTW
jgi:CheY-like chemotaxis protein